MVRVTRLYLHEMETVRRSSAVEHLLWCEPRVVRVVVAHGG